MSQKKDSDETLKKCINVFIIVLLAMLFFIIYHLSFKGFEPYIKKIALMYEIDNYRYVLSALIQSLATILALIISSTIILFQLTRDNSPKSINFFPTGELFLTLILIMLEISIDTLILLTLRSPISSKVFIMIVVVSVANLLTIFTILKYIVKIKDWLKPDNTLNNLLRNVSSIDESEKFIEIIRSIEELALSSINKGYSTTVTAIFKAYYDLSNMIVKKFDFKYENMESWSDNPLIVLPESLTNVCINLCNSNMYNLIFRAVNVFKPLIYWKSPLSDAAGKRIFYDSIIESFISIVKEYYRNARNENLMKFIRYFYFYVSINGKVEDTVIKCTKKLLEEALIQEDHNVIALVLEQLRDMAQSYPQIGSLYKPIFDEIKASVVFNKSGENRVETIEDQLKLIEKEIKSANILQTNK